jgi:hypothetical protein
MDPRQAPQGRGHRPPAPSAIPILRRALTCGHRNSTCPHARLLRSHPQLPVHTQRLPYFAAASDTPLLGSSWPHGGGVGRGTPSPQVSRASARRVSYERQFGLPCEERLAPDPARDLGVRQGLRRDGPRGTHARCAVGGATSAPSPAGSPLCCRASRTGQDLVQDGRRHCGVLGLVPSSHWTAVNRQADRPRRGAPPASLPDPGGQLRVTAEDTGPSPSLRPRSARCPAHSLVAGARALVQIPPPATGSCMPSGRVLDANLWPGAGRCARSPDRTAPGAGSRPAFPRCPP